MLSRKEQKEQRRQQILAAALDEFIEKGFYGTSTNEIAKRCGISSGLMFHYFSSKEELYLAILEKATSGTTQLNTLVPHSLPPLALLEKIAAFTLQMFKEEPASLKTFVFIKQAMFTAVPFAGVNDAFAKMNLIETLAPLIAKGQAAGEIAPGDPIAMSTLFFSALRGVAEIIYKYPQLPPPQPEWLTAFLKP